MKTNTKDIKRNVKEYTVCVKDVHPIVFIIWYVHLYIWIARVYMPITLCMSLPWLLAYVLNLESVYIHIQYLNIPKPKYEKSRMCSNIRILRCLGGIGDPPETSLCYNIHNTDNVSGILQFFSTIPYLHAFKFYLQRMLT